VHADALLRSNLWPRRIHPNTPGSMWRIGARGSMLVDSDKHSQCLSESCVPETTSGMKS
jgi:hypothetical protein